MGKNKKEGGRGGAIRVLSLYKRPFYLNSFIPLFLIIYNYIKYKGNLEE